MKLVLCSASPRRREFLERIGVGFSLAPAHIDETRGPGEAAVAFVERIEGSFSNVVGLPLEETLEILAEAGVELPWRWRRVSRACAGASRLPVPGRAAIRPRCG